MKSAAWGTVREFSPWFSRLAEFAKFHRGHPCFKEMLKVANRFPNRQNVARMRNAIASIPRGDGVRSELLRTVDAVLFGEFRDQFRFSFHTYPRNPGQVSAASELFSLIRQALAHDWIG